MASVVGQEAQEEQLQPLQPVFPLPFPPRGLSL